MARSHKHRIELSSSPDDTFRLLILPSAIREWWSAAQVVVLPQDGGTWAAAWGEDQDDPDFITTANIKKFDPPNQLVLTDYRYYSAEGELPFEPKFTTTFTVLPADTGSILEVEQVGFPDESVADEFYEGCVEGWQNTFDAIESFVSRHYSAVSDR